MIMSVVNNQSNNMTLVRKLASKTSRCFARNVYKATEIQKLGKRRSPRSSLSTVSSVTSTSEHSIVVKEVGESAEMEHAVESLRSALHLLKDASNKSCPWVDARNLLDETAAALDDAGLALRSKSANSEQQSESYVLKLADKVVHNRRRLLGGSFVHDVDGVWTKSVYGDCNGISFGTDDDEFCRIPVEEKEEKALIVYASQTGTSKTSANNLCKSLGGDAHCVVRNMKSVGIKDLAMHKRVYIICSTSGLGRPPRDGETFYSNVQLNAMRCKENLEDLSIGDEENEKPLAGTSIAIATLGSSALEDFAKFGLDLTEELVTLGAAIALDTITIDGKNGKTEQKQMFQQWESRIIQMEKERLMER
uniref:Flavodoxin-like domain-containing protein n=1 Tax=Ditylum brightwellii TaxID=49249 RepID=A0A7S4S820_9STRA